MTPLTEKFINKRSESNKGNEKTNFVVLLVTSMSSTTWLLLTLQFTIN